MNPKFRLAVCAAAIIALTGCATTSPMLQPSVAMAPRYDEPIPAGSIAVSPDWWQRFGSQELQSLVQAALAGSPDLAIAMERVRQAEAQVGIAGASLFPTLNLGFGTSRKTSGGDAGSRTSDASSTTLNVSYEVDLWGRNAAGVRGANEALRGTVYDRDAAQLTLIAGVATGYFQLLSLRSRLALARDNLAIAERVQALVATRARNGVATQLDVERQDATVLAQRAALMPLEQQERQTLAALAVLIGRTPQGFDVVSGGIADLQVPVIDPGLPADLLVRRPDIASAEARLGGANADLAAARAALLPSIQLTGAAGVSSAALLTILGGPSTAISLAMSVLQPIFDGGRLRGQVRVSESVERELVESYRKVILTALGEVESALVAASRVAQQETLQAEVLAKAQNALRLAEVRYREGADDLLTVLDAQRSLFDAQDRLAQIKLERLNGAVDLFKALGGGWNVGGTNLAAAKM
ncbi:MAG: efflux transporter outer membrane subunit [Betaproteobacteria bacterium]|nr:efflux transporter outer membrane subunit [Betaproteobacteria bacterium]